MKGQLGKGRSGRFEMWRVGGLRFVDRFGDFISLSQRQSLTNAYSRYLQYLQYLLTRVLVLGIARVSLPAIFSLFSLFSLGGELILQRAEGTCVTRRTFYLLACSPLVP